MAQNKTVVDEPVQDEVVEESLPSTNVRSVTLIIIAAMLVLATLWWAQAVIIPVVLGSQFEAAVPLTFVLIGAMVFLGMRGILGTAFRAVDQPEVESAAELVGLGVTIGALTNGTMLGITVFWVVLYGAGFALSWLPEPWPSPERYLDRLRFVLKGEYQSAGLSNLMLGAGRPNSGLSPAFQSGGPRTVQAGLTIRF